MLIGSLIPHCVQIHALGRVAQRRGFDGPTLGAREATAAPRTFTEAQLRESREHEKLLYAQVRPRPLIATDCH